MKPGDKRVVNLLLTILVVVGCCCDRNATASRFSRVHIDPMKHTKARKLGSTKDPGLNKTKLPKSNGTTSFAIEKLLHFYNRQDPPDPLHPTEVMLGIYINSFYSISEQTMDYSVSMYLRQQWRDDRLTFNPKTYHLNQVRLGENSWNKIWVPDTFFRNEKRATFHEVTVNNRMLRLNYTGHVWYVTKVSATLSCPMKLYKYPFDTQMCPMLFESFGYTMDSMYFSWIDKPVEIDKDIQLPQFVYKHHALFDCVQNYTGENTQ